MQNSNVPEVLYKYYSPSSWKNVFKSWTMRFSPPKDLNDPFEVRITCKKWLNRCDRKRALKDNPNIIRDYTSTIRDKKERKAFEKKCKKKILQKLSELSKNTTNSEHNMVISEALRSRLGVLCLSETYEDILMWSHYAYYHKGFVIGIKTSNLITYLRKNFKDCDKIGFKKVNYTNLRNKENLNEFLSLKPFYEKNSLWEYEKEWRALLDIEIDWDKWKKVYLRNKEMKGIFSIPTECISKIIFGAMMEDSHIRAKCRHIRSQSGCQHITFERMRLHSTEYALVAERIPDDFWKKR